MKRMNLWLVALLATAPLIACSYSPAKKSGRGQACSASNDCEKDLLCIVNTSGGGVCVQNEYPVADTAKVCDVYECESDVDCCEDFEPDEQCPDMEAACDPEDPLTQPACDFVDDYCSCTEVCNENQRCVDAPDPCATDDDCYFGMCDTASGECVECVADDDCDEDEMCIEGACASGCKKNEDCPIFNTCNIESGLCEESGCTGDRECILWTGKADSQCLTRDGVDYDVCIVPCQENAECGTLDVCKDGECVFLGCESDEECRTYLGVDDNNVWGEDARAVCRDREDGTDEGATAPSSFF